MDQENSPPAKLAPATDTLIIATTDPAIILVADYQPEWKRHPEATTNLLTSQMGEPVPLSTVVSAAAAITEMLRTWQPPGRSQETNRMGTAGNDLRPADAPAGSHPIEAHRQTLADRADANALNRRDQPNHPASRRGFVTPRPRPSESWFPWIAVAAVLLGGVIGAAISLQIVNHRSRDPSTWS